MDGLKRKLLLSPGSKDKTEDEKNPKPKSKPSASSRMAIKQKLFNSNRPKILLETATSAIIKWFTFITYVAFIIGVTCDLITIVQSFQVGKNSNLASSQCGTTAPVNYNGLKVCDNASPEFSGGSASCGCSIFEANSTTWKGVFYNVKNVISMQLDIKNYNFTYVEGPAQSHNLEYSVQLYACYNYDGCNAIGGDNNYDGYKNWLPVLDLTQREIENYATSTSTQLDLGIFPNTYQFQQSVPSEGLIKSYFINVVYTHGYQNLYKPYYDGGCLFTDNSASSECTENYLFYVFRIVNRQVLLKDASLIIRMLTFFSTLVALYIYVKAIFYRKYRDPKFTILTEQWWILFYILGVVLYQNPVYVSILLGAKQTPSLAEISLLFDQLMQNILFFVWLLFADSIFKSMRSRIGFYWAKVVLCLLMVIFEIIVIKDQFSHENPVEALSSWSHKLKISYITFCLLILFLQWIWLCNWLINLYSSSKVLAKLPYMNTRYLQLSNRFFSLQSTAVFLYYLALYLTISIEIYIHIAHNSQTSITEFTDNVSTLFAEQTLMFGKSLLFSVYAIILAFCYLPADFNDENWMLGTLLTNFVLTEDEMRTEKAQRIRSSKKLGYKKLLLNPLAFNVKTEIFCVNVGLRMRELSFQSYYDIEGLVTASHFPGGMHLKEHDFEFVDAFYDPTKEVFCFVTRDLKNRALNVCFRGTASQKQMQENLKYKLKELDPFSNRLTALDLIDGLMVNADSFLEDIHTLKDFYKKLSDAEDAEILKNTRSSSMDSRSSNGSLSDLEKDIGESKSNPNSLASFSVNHNDSHSINSSDRKDYDPSRQQSIFIPMLNGANKVVNATTDLAFQVASMTPGLKNFVNCQVHTGFYESYEVARGFVNAVLRRELVKEPVRVYFTGHSLGGALSSYAALDVAIHTIPRVHAHLILKNAEFVAEGRPELVQDLAHLNVSLYTFGSPRPGNPGYADFHADIVTDSFRVVCDGDLVTSLPPGKVGYKHLKTEVLIDKFFSGSIIVDPSFVEKRFRTQTKSSVSSHSLFVYGKALIGVKQATEYMNSNMHVYATEEGYIDTIQLALDTEKQLQNFRENSVDKGGDEKKMIVMAVSPMEIYFNQSILVAPEGGTVEVEEGRAVDEEGSSGGGANTNPLTANTLSKINSNSNSATSSTKNNNNDDNEYDAENDISENSSIIALEKQYEDQMRKSMKTAMQKDSSFVSRTKTFFGDL